ncbi:CPCC family cysteine-rich protein [Micromonospora zamorensis]|uniref:CPCC family cysteine-rich protein n=1 Tax=Micromonospora zamorensis TaxID=709883 RepID=UPI003D9130BB
MDLPYPCVCCGYRTLGDPPGSHETCRVCRWEDDVYQLRWPHRAGGANKSSLIEAQHNFGLYGACDKDSLAENRADPADYDREPHWRTIDLQRDRFEPGGGALAAWPDNRTVLYWWRRRTGETWWDDAQAIGLPEPPVDDADPTASPRQSAQSHPWQPRPVRTTSRACRSTSTTTCPGALRSGK